MKITAVLFLTLPILFSSIGCTRFAIKNRATVLAAEKFDDELIRHSKDLYPDPEQQNLFAEFIKKNTRVEIDNVEVNDESATSDLAIVTPKSSVYPQLVGVSGKEWQGKVDKEMETRKYKLVLKRVKDIWEISEQKPVTN